MQCGKCKGKKGKMVPKMVYDYRVHKNVEVKRFEECDNCKGHGQVEDESNVTNFQLEEIKKFSLIKNFRNNWRQRNVFLYQHPNTPELVVSVGYPFNGGGATICEENKEVYQLS